MPLDLKRLTAAYESAKTTLLAERSERHWVGELSTSALSTATAVSALALVAKAESGKRKAESLQPLIQRGAKYLLAQQNKDGGWGDTNKSYSNVATTYLAVAALHLSGQATSKTEALLVAESYLAHVGNVNALKRRYGTDQTFVVPILTNCALAGLVDWRQVDPLPFELACVPQSWYRFVGMPVVSYAIPALIAIGQANYFHRSMWNPLWRFVRTASVAPSLRVLRDMQPTSGGYLEAVPLTSFVVMSLAATGRADHAVTDLGVKFLIDSVRPDGSWPIDTNLATWVTTLSLNALASGGEDIPQYANLDWLLHCQHLQRHPFTGAEPGGWGWSDLSGAVPDADDTPGAILALQAWYESPSCPAGDKAMIRPAIESGIEWLLNLQNRNGGWPTFCKGWGRLPFDRSGVDLTAHVLRAMFAVHGESVLHASTGKLARVRRAVERGWEYIESHQRADGSWLPLWFGNQDQPDDENPIYGTTKVLFAYRDGGRTQTSAAQRGFQFLLARQNADGGWGGGAAVREAAKQQNMPSVESTIEETALAVEALLAAPRTEKFRQAIEFGVAWLCQAIENNRLFESAPIGFYFAKLWYYERLYPLTFAVSALGRAKREIVEW
jgi:squalene-hopene/tetraprenyl-beta-curcumene cyclase